MSGLEAVGAVTSAMQFAAYTYRALQVLRSLISDLRSAPQRIQRKAAWLQSLIEILEYVELHQVSMFPNVRQSIQDIYTQAVELQTTLINSLRRIQIRSPKRYWRAAVFALAEEPEILNALAALEQDKSNLHFWVSVVGSSQSTQRSYTMSSSKTPNKVQKAPVKKGLFSRSSRKREKEEQDTAPYSEKEPGPSKAHLEDAVPIPSPDEDDDRDGGDGKALVHYEQDFKDNETETTIQPSRDLVDVQKSTGSYVVAMRPSYTAEDDQQSRQASFSAASSISSSRSARRRARQARKGRQHRNSVPANQNSDIYKGNKMGTGKNSHMGSNLIYRTTGDRSALHRKTVYMNNEMEGGDSCLMGPQVMDAETFLALKQMEYLGKPASPQIGPGD